MLPDIVIEPFLTEYPPIVKIVGVGGCGGNIAKHVFDSHVEGVSFAVCNTDPKALFNSPITKKIAMGGDLGAGGDPQKGLESAQSSQEEIMELFNDGTQMAFITAGLGKGTGTGAGPYVARLAKDRGILTVGFVCLPPDLEGEEKMALAKKGMSEMRKSADAIIVVDTQRIFDLYSNLSIDASFAKADDIMTDAAKAMADIVNKSGRINIDMADVRTVLRDSGDVVMAYGKASGENRARVAMETALDSPLLLQTRLAGAKAMLLNIMTSTSNGLMAHEYNFITDYLRIEKGVGKDTTLHVGLMNDESLGDELSVTIVATGLDPDYERRRVSLEEHEPFQSEVKVAVKPAAPRPVTPPVVQPSLFDSLDYSSEEEMNIPAYERNRRF